MSLQCALSAQGCRVLMYPGFGSVPGLIQEQIMMVGAMLDTLPCQGDSHFRSEMTAINGAHCAPSLVQVVHGGNLLCMPLRNKLALVTALHLDSWVGARVSSCSVKVELCGCDCLCAVVIACAGGLLQQLRSIADAAKVLAPQRCDAPPSNAPPGSNASACIAAASDTLASNHAAAGVAAGQDGCARECAPARQMREEEAAGVQVGGCLTVDKGVHAIALPLWPLVTDVRVLSAAA
eukprot:1156794-Pelagomonas_calceolata.AAC.1